MASVTNRELHWEKLGNWVRERRELLRITQVEFSNITGMKQPNVCRLEKGRHSATLETLVRVADALDVHVVDLLKILLGKKF